MSFARKDFALGLELELESGKEAHLMTTTERMGVLQALCKSDSWFSSPFPFRSVDLYTPFSHFSDPLSLT